MTVAIRNEANPAELGDVSDLEQLTAKQKRALAREDALTTPFESGDRLFGDWDSGNVFDYGDPNARDLRDMLETDGTPRQMEQVLTLPIRAADAVLQGGSRRGRKTITDNVPPAQLEQLIAQATSAVIYRKAFWELTWSLDDGAVHLDGIAFRPATACQAAYDEHGRPIGFRMRVHHPGGRIDTDTWTRLTKGEQPGWVRLPKQRSLIVTHGTHREPLRGISDLSVAYWAHETRKKLLFLWLQYLESQSLPRVVAYGNDPTEAKRNAEMIAKTRPGGVAPATRKDAAARPFDIIESSGKGADQFVVADRHLTQFMVDSVLAGFTQLTGAASSGTGSYALSADQSEFFLQSRQAVADEIATQITVGLFAPICIYNGLKPSDVPQLKIGPISQRSSDRALDMLKTIIASPQLNVPGQFVDDLVLVVAPMLQLEPDALRAAIEEHRAAQKRKDELAEQMQAQLAAGGAAPGQVAASGTGTEDDPQPPRELATAIDVMHEVMLAKKRGEDPAVALANLRQAAREVVDLATKTDEPAEQHTGGMVALIPDTASARKLAIAGGEPAEQLHLTLAYLGDDVTSLDDDVRAELPYAVRSAIAEAGITGPIQARAFAHTTFNADGGRDGDRDPCAVYGIGDSTLIAPLQRAVVEMLGDVDGLALPVQHEPFVPHVTAGYDKTAADLRFLGDLRFDRVALALGDSWTYFPLGATKENAGD